MGGGVKPSGQAPTGFRRRTPPPNPLPQGEGENMSVPPSPLCTSSSANTWIVLPSSMSSARQAPRPRPDSRCSHCRPARWARLQRARRAPGRDRRRLRRATVAQASAGDAASARSVAEGRSRQPRLVPRIFRNLAPASRRIASVKLSPCFAASASASRNRASVRSRLSRSVHPAPAQQHKAVGAGEQGADPPPRSAAHRPP